MTNNSGFDDFNSILETVELSTIQSKNPIEKIKQSIRYNLIWAIGISLGLLVLLFFVSFIVKLLLGIVFIWCIWACNDSYKTLQKLEYSMDASSTLLDYLKAQKSYFLDWKTTQEKTALAIYPISITGGFILGAQVAGQQEIWLFLSQKTVMLALALCWLLFTPLCYYGTKLLFHLGFNSHIKQLERTIESLEQDA
ncbi:MAG: hypothetical protein K1X82_06070 [Bacteroidia bacterium]|nr:hypothetical protein [Bacteroidia bacterium]